ncbi:hypothetical protein CPT_Summit_097 [Stenotrophomonas phage Summit]|nr:hypothetical protein CPT_Summit_097 [Stenotrophomonas phage Summit]
MNHLWNKRREKLELELAQAAIALIGHVGTSDIRLHLSEGHMICIGSREGIAHLLDATLGEEKIAIGVEKEEPPPIQPSKKAQLSLVIPEPKP